MRLWSLDLVYLDRIGLIALWREALLAQKVLQGLTKGYKNHPQLDRFKSHPDPMAAIGVYLTEIYLEAKSRGYNFDFSKVVQSISYYRVKEIPVTQGQLDYEFKLLSKKLEKRSFDNLANMLDIIEEDGGLLANRLFDVVPGEIEPWERVKEFA